MREDVPIPRCCERHDNWATLAQHVVNSFPSASLVDVARELRVARDVVELVDLGDDALVLADLVARHRLMVATGAVGERARLAPQSHPPRRRTPDTAPRD